MSRLDAIKGEMDAIDRRFQAIGDPRPQTRDELRAVVDEWRSFPSEYDALLGRARPLSEDARKQAGGELGVGEMWKALIVMLEHRRDGTEEIVGLFDQALEGAPPEAIEERIEELKTEQDVLNARFHELATAYNEKLDG